MRYQRQIFVTFNMLPDRAWNYSRTILSYIVWTSSYLIWSDIAVLVVPVYWLSFSNNKWEDPAWYRLHGIAQKFLTFNMLHDRVLDYSGTLLYRVITLNHWLFRWDDTAHEVWMDQIDMNHSRVETALVQIWNISHIVIFSHIRISWGTQIWKKIV